MLAGMAVSAAEPNGLWGAVKEAFASSSTLAAAKSDTGANELVKGVLDIMKRLAASGMTMAVVTHELRFAREAANQVAFLDRGRLVECGPPDQLFEAPASPRLKEFLAQML